MKYAKVKYHGALIEVPVWLVNLLPKDLPLDHWPTFCGAGSGFGDWIVPDKIKKLCISPECLVHDLDWAVSDSSWAWFQATNNRFLRNLISRLVSKLDGWILVRSLVWAVGYWFVVSSPLGWANYGGCGKNWDENQIVKDKLHRLAMAEIEYMKLQKV